MEKDFDTDQTNDLIELLKQVDEHIEYLNSSIIVLEDEKEEEEDVETL